jgi:hypothetical protein
MLQDMIVRYLEKKIIKPKQLRIIPHMNYPLLVQIYTFLITFSAFQIMAY